MPGSTPVFFPFPPILHRRRQFNTPLGCLVVGQSASQPAQHSRRGRRRMRIEWKEKWDYSTIKSGQGLAEKCANDLVAGWGPFIMLIMLSLILHRTLVCVL
ncbi:hypothetical protein RRG08_056193 [Elysia crispata]|uniref:Uncharacterized protein n=1 Tax=Elysia crispata TaxID=231223 RepID=A0AAE1D7X8_9GAST|nr:hypothetical protein RRG08_056193 [Elysia crispata]